MPFGPKGESGGRTDGRTDGRTEGRTTGLGKLDCLVVRKICLFLWQPTYNYFLRFVTIEGDIKYSKKIRIMYILARVCQATKKSMQSLPFVS